MVIGRRGYSDRGGIILIGMAGILIEQGLLSSALQGALSGWSENR
jgi:hypothetical protein